MFLCARCGSNKKRARTYYAEVVFLHSVRYVGHVVCSGASEAQNEDAPILMLGWAHVDPTKSAQVHAR
jgi:hypothetical protein